MKPWKRILIAVPIALAAAVAALAIRGNSVPQITALPDPPVPTPNAFDEFARAYSDFHDLDLVKKYVDNEKLEPTSLQYPIDRLGVPESRHLIAENQTGLAMLRRGIGDGYCERPQHTFAARYPYLGFYRAMVRVLALDARLRERDGDWSGAMDDLLDILQMGDQVSCHGTLIPKLVSVACGYIGRPTAWAASQNVSREEAFAAERRMETITSHREPLAVALTYEQDLGDTSLVDLFSSREPLNDVTGAEHTLSGLFANIRYFTLRPKSRTLTLYNMYMAKGAADLKLPYSQAIVVGSPMIPEDVFCHVMCPTPSKLIFKDTQDLTFNRLLMTTLAIRAYSLDHNGAYPQTLAQLRPIYMSQMPVDPFGTSNASLVYRTTGCGYLLYSVGPDGKDDGGRPCIGWLGDGNKSMRTYQATDSGDIVAGINNG